MKRRVLARYNRRGQRRQTLCTVLQLLAVIAAIAGMIAVAAAGFPAILLAGVALLSVIGNSRIADSNDARVALWADEEEGELVLNRCPFGFSVPVFSVIQLKLVDGAKGPALWLLSDGKPKLVSCHELEGEPEALKQQIGRYLNSQSGYLEY